MIVYKEWESKARPGIYWGGWFLLGFIPLYLRRYGTPR